MLVDGVQYVGLTTVGQLAGDTVHRRACVPKAVDATAEALSKLPAPDPGAFGRHHQGAADPLWRNRALCRELLSGKKVIKSQAGDFGLFVFQTPVSLCFLLRLQARC